MHERARLTVAVVLTLAITLAFVADTFAWRSAGQGWLHSDGVIHLERIQLYAAALRGDPVDPGVRLVVGYGPLPYQVGARWMNLAGATDWATASLAWVGFGALGVLGTALLAARLGGVWAAPTAAALLVGMPVWRTHGIDLLVDGPGASTAVVALGLLAWSDGLRRPRWVLAAGIATGVGLVCRWPNAALLGPVWAGMIVVAATRAPGPAWMRVLGVLAVGATTILGLCLPLWGLSSGLSLPTRLAVAGLTGGLALLLAKRASTAPEGWLGRAMGGGLAILTAALPAVLWSPNGFVMGMESQVAMEQDIATTMAMAAPEVAGGGWDVLPTLAAWWTGPHLALVILLGAGLAMRRRPVLTGLLMLGAGANILVVLGLLAEPDERHVLASLPVLIAVAGATAAGRAAPLVAPLLSGIGLLGLLGWHAPSLPGVVASSPWQRDINLVRNVDASFETSGWGPETPPWRSILPAEGNPYADVAEALLDHFGTASGCLAWVSEDTIREHLPFDAHVHRLEPPLLEAGSRLQGEDPHDRPGATLGRYDGAVVWAVSENGLAERVARALGDATELLVLELPLDADDRGVRLHVLAAPGTDWAPDGCKSRFPGTEVLPLGQGWRTGIRILDELDAG